MKTRIDLLKTGVHVFAQAAKLTEQHGRIRGLCGTDGSEIGSQFLQRLDQCVHTEFQSCDPPFDVRHLVPHVRTMCRPDCMSCTEHVLCRTLAMEQIRMTTMPSSAAEINSESQHSESTVAVHSESTITS